MQNQAKPTVKIITASQTKPTATVTLTTAASTANKDTADDWCVGVVEQSVEELLRLTQAVQAQRTVAKLQPDYDPVLDEESSYDFDQNLVKLKEEKSWLNSGKFSEEETISNGITGSVNAMTDGQQGNDTEMFQPEYKIYKRVYKNTFLEHSKESELKKLITGDTDIPIEVKEKYRHRIWPLAITPIPVET
jgi:hypothetical protein